jgi:hypothetical protein
VLLNLLITAPVYALCKRLVPPRDWTERAQEVQLLG